MCWNEGDLGTWSAWADLSISAAEGKKIDRCQVLGVVNSGTQELELGSSFPSMSNSGPVEIK